MKGSLKGLGAPFTDLIPSLQVSFGATSLINNRMVRMNWDLGAFRIRFKVWDRWVGSIQDP